MGVDVKGPALRRRLAKARSAAALLNSTATLPGSRSQPVVGPRPVRRRRTLKRVAKEASALDGAIAELNKLVKARELAASRPEREPPTAAARELPTAAARELPTAAARSPVAPSPAEAEAEGEAVLRTLEARKVTLEARLEEVRELQRRVDGRADPRLAARAETKRNADLALDLLEDLRREARVQACERAVRFYERRRRRPATPPFVALLRDIPSKTRAARDALAGVDALLARAARGRAAPDAAEPCILADGLRIFV